jgi:hypothetical protein
MALIFRMWKRYIKEWTGRGISTAYVKVRAQRQPKVSTNTTAHVFLRLTITTGKTLACIPDALGCILARDNDNPGRGFTPYFRAKAFTLLCDKSLSLAPV